jgi:hypothetical protein
MTRKPLDALRHHVTGAIERGEAAAVVEQRAVTHTPGPWISLSDGRIYAPGEIVADTTFGCLSRGTTDANARLIAAAPDLLAALQRCLAFMERIAVEDCIADTIGENQARAAIRKAKGE